MESGKKARNGSLDLMKFVFSIVIVLLHSGNLFGRNKFFPAGHIGVEFFYIVSGYYMAKSALRYVDVDSKQIGTITLKYIWHKIKHILPYFIVSCLVSFTLLHSINPTDFFTMGKDALYMLSEMFMLQMAGFPGYWATGVAWYLSAMFLSMLIMYPLLLKNRDVFMKIIVPFNVTFVLGWVYYNYGTIGSPDILVLGLVFKGVLRAVIGLSIGCLCYQVSEVLKRYNYTSFMRALLTIIEVGGYVLVIYYANICYPGTVELVWILILLISVTITQTEKSYFYQCFKSSFFGFLGELSMYIYLCHHYWSSNLYNVIGYDATEGQALTMYLLFTALTVFGVMLIVKLLKLIGRKLKPSVLKLILVDENRKKEHL